MAWAGFPHAPPSRGTPAALSHAGRRCHCSVQTSWPWDDRPVNDYLVAAHPARHGSVSQAPEGKRHAYLAGADTTACGFGLNAMQRFAGLRFSLQPPAVRCPLCARVVGANR